MNKANSSDAREGIASKPATLVRSTSTRIIDAVVPAPGAARRLSGRLAAAICAGCALGLSAPAAAGEIRYRYDALGRVTGVDRTGTSTSGGSQTQYSYDRAGNRTKKVFEGPASGMVVTHINGMYVPIPFDRN